MNRFTFSQCALPAAALFALWPAFAQTTTPINIVNVSGTTALAPIVRPVSLTGTGTLTPFGSAAVTFNGTQDQRTGLVQGTFTFVLNRLNTFSVTAPAHPVSKMATLNLTGPITGGTGTFSGATGSLTYTFTYTANSSNSGTFTLSGSGNVTVGATQTTITQASFNGAVFLASAAGGTFQVSPTGSVSPFGIATVNFSGMENTRGGAIQGALTFVFNANDSFIASFSTEFSFTNPSTILPCTITGGTGEFSGATGSLNATFALGAEDNTFTLTGTGSITQPPAGSPIITAVTTAYAGSAIAQNTYIVITGTNLVPANTPANGVVWSKAPSFASGQLPTQLEGVSVTVDNKPAFVYFYCSAATDSACALDQLNILTPLDATIGPATVVVTSGGVAIPPFTANLQAVAPSFLVFTAAGYIAARHADKDSTLVGPTSLYPGSSTPARPWETITLYGVGFGLPATPLVNGSSTQSGSLPTLPVCQVSGTTAALAFAGVVGPGLYQLNLTIPATAVNGDNALVCTYNGLTTPAGDVITVQN